MARTKASVGSKVSSVKSSKARAAAAPPPPPPSKRKSGGSKARSSLVGANPVCPRETPEWQLPITRFFQNKSTNATETNNDNSGSSKPPDNNNEIGSDESDDETVATPVSSSRDGVSKSPNNKVDSDESDGETEGTSGSYSNQGSSKHRKRIVIESDESDDDSPVNETSAGAGPSCSILDSSIDLPPLDGESSHKIAEYFPKAEAKSQKTPDGKENIHKNDGNSGKRNLEEERSVNKKAKTSA